MIDCTYTLFETLLQQSPYVPSVPMDQEVLQRLEAAQARVKDFPPEYRRGLFELTDSLNILAYNQAHHAFLLGLDLGLSLSRELSPLQKHV